MSLNPPKVDYVKLVNEQTASDYHGLLGNEAWQRLHPDIQIRFGERVHDAVTYQGVMREIYSSRAGKLLAQLCRLIGTPLATHSGRDVPVMVKVYPSSQPAGMCWDRFYAFNNKITNRVKSTKCIRAGQGLVEMVGFGFGMELKMKEVEGGLCFESRRFFWEFGKLRVIIPEILTPGKTIVSQRALEDKSFEFRLDVKHPILGKVFRQIGVFKKI